MNLGQRLDSLRGQTGRRPLARPSAHASAHQDASDSPCRALAQCLSAEVDPAGFVLIDSVIGLDHAVDNALPLHHLPETLHLDDADWVYIDTETTGLSGGVGNMAFMVGVARLCATGHLALRQYLLPGFAAEAAMLRDLDGYLGQRAVLVSYNGKCFDLPLLSARARLHALPSRWPGYSHLDLMYGVRRAYAGRWPDCRLQTAEQRRLGVHRRDDLPGAEAPAAWQAWLRDHETVSLQGVLAHNAQDVISLALLHKALVTDCQGGGGTDVNHAAVGRAWMQAGHVDRALAVWEGAGADLSPAGQMDLARAYRRQARWRDAESLWLRLHRDGNADAACELSKYHEHQRRDYRQAMSYASACSQSEQKRRIRRLHTKIGRNLSLPL